MANGLRRTRAKARACRVLTVLGFSLAIAGQCEASPFVGASLVGAFRVSIVTCRDGSCAPTTELGMRFNYFIAQDMSVEDRAAGRSVMVFRPGIPQVEGPVPRQWDLAGDRLVQTVSINEDGFRVVFAPADDGKCAISFEPLPREGSVDHSRLTLVECRMTRADAAEP